MPGAPLTSRELKVVEMVASAASDRKIANALGMTIAGVKQCLWRIRKKRGLGSRVEIAAWWLTRDMVPRHDLQLMRKEYERRIHYFKKQLSVYRSVFHRPGA